MRGGFKAKVAEPSRAVFARSRTLFPVKRMRAGSPGPEAPRTPPKEARLDAGSPARRLTTDEDALQEGMPAILQMLLLPPPADLAFAPAGVQVLQLRPAGCIADRRRTLHDCMCVMHCKH